MTVLPDHEICKLSQPSVFVLIEPFSLDQLQPASYDVRLASTILEPRLRNLGPIDTRKPAEDRTEPVDITKGYALYRGDFILGATVEWVNIPPTMVGRVEGKSSRARQGIQIHSAGYLDPGFRGNVTLEIVNFGESPVILYPDILIGQLSFERLSSRCEHPYSGRYQDSYGAVDSRFGQPLPGEHDADHSHP